MSTQELYNILKNEIAYDLTGLLSYDGTVVKWEYDGIDHLHNSLEEQLDLVAFDDKQIIEECLGNYDEFFVSEPETHDTFIYFYIEK